MSNEAFSHQLQSLGILTTHPYRSSPYADKRSHDYTLMAGRFYLPPLFHALYQRSWGLALELLRQDNKALMEKTGPYTTVLDHTMSLGVTHPDIIRFLFASHSILRTTTLVPSGTFVDAKYSESGGYHVFRLVHDNITGGNPRDLAEIGILRGDVLKSACRSVDDVWKCLLELFPDVENAPSARFAGFLPYKKLSVLEQSVRLHADFRSIRYSQMFRTLLPLANFAAEVPPAYEGFRTVRATIDAFSSLERRRVRFPRQTWLERLQSSPLDLMSPEGKRKSGLSRYGWTVSLWHPSIFGGVLVVAVLTVVIYAIKVRPFFWWGPIPNLVTVLILYLCLNVLCVYSSSWVTSMYIKDGRVPIPWIFRWAFFDLWMSKRDVVRNFS